MVITIIILIILAGISINLVLGEEGIFKRALEAREKTEQAQRNEQEMFNNLSNAIDNMGALADMFQPFNSGSIFDAVTENSGKQIAVGNGWGASLSGAVPDCELCVIAVGTSGSSDHPIINPISVSNCKGVKPIASGLNRGKIGDSNTGGACSAVLVYGCNASTASCYVGNGYVFATMVWIPIIM